MDSIFSLVLSLFQISQETARRFAVILAGRLVMFPCFVFALPFHFRCFAMHLAKEIKKGVIINLIPMR